MNKLANTFPLSIACCATPTDELYLCCCSRHRRCLDLKVPTKLQPPPPPPKRRVVMSGAAEGTPTLKRLRRGREELSSAEMAGLVVGPMLRLPSRTATLESKPILQLYWPVSGILFSYYGYWLPHYYVVTMVTMNVAMFSAGISRRKIPFIQHNGS